MLLHARLRVIEMACHMFIRWVRNGYSRTELCIGDT